MESIRRGGRPVSGFGVGADAVGSGIAALQAAIAQYGGASAADPVGAVAGLQTAGNAAVGAVGPAIDALSGSNPDVMKVTQSAWQQNGKLAAVNNSASATQADVNAAKAIAQQMLTSYQQAQRLAQPAAKAPATSGSGSGPTTTASVTPTVSAPWSLNDSGTTRALLWIAGGTVASVVVVGGVALVVRRRAARTAVR